MKREEILSLKVDIYGIIQHIDQMYARPEEKCGMIIYPAEPLINHLNDVLNKAIETDFNTGIFDSFKDMLKDILINFSHKYIYNLSEIVDILFKAIINIFYLHDIGKCSTGFLKVVCNKEITPGDYNRGGDKSHSFFSVIIYNYIFYDLILNSTYLNKFKLNKYSDECNFLLYLITCFSEDIYRHHSDRLDITSFLLDLENRARFNKDRYIEAKDYNELAYFIPASDCGKIISTTYEVSLYHSFAEKLDKVSVKISNLCLRIHKLLCECDCRAVEEYKKSIEESYKI